MNIGVLFDLDGVVIDSESVYTELWNDIEKIYPTGIENFALKIKGFTLPEILGTYYPNINQQKKIRQIIKDFELHMEYRPFPEAMRFIAELRANNVKCAIVTSSSMQKMENLYVQNPTFREQFDAVITSDVVTYSKPHPEPYLRGSKALDIEISDCFVFEDSLSGIQSGINAGATVIGLATTLPFSQINGKAHKTIMDFTGFHLGNMLNCKIR